MVPSDHWCTHKDDFQCWRRRGARWATSSRRAAAGPGSRARSCWPGSPPPTPPATASGTTGDLGGFLRRHDVTRHKLNIDGDRSHQHWGYWLEEITGALVALAALAVQDTRPLAA